MFKEILPEKKCDPHQRRAVAEACGYEGAVVECGEVKVWADETDWHSGYAIKSWWSPATNNDMYKRLLEKTSRLLREAFMHKTCPTEAMREYGVLQNYLDILASGDIDALEVQCYRLIKGYI